MSRERLARKFPSLIHLRASELGSMASDRHSVMYGEIIRWRMLFEKLDSVGAKADRLGWKPEIKMETLLQTLHDHFVGSLRRASGRKTVPMYKGTPADFDRNYPIWRDACRDVEELYDYLLSYLPRRLEVHGQNRDLHHMLRRPEEVRSTHNPIKLLDVARSQKPDDREFSDWAWVRRSAQSKLVLAQSFFEYRRAGYAPETLEDESVLIKRILEQTLFRRGSKEKVKIVAALDRDHAFACKTYRYAVPRESSLPSDTQFTIETNRYLLRVGEGIPVLFFIRPKRFPVLKGLIKDIRFPQLANIGDGVAMTFALDSESDVDAVVGSVRRVLVPCPGSVCDQDSNLGHRGDRKLDERNGSSSKRFKAMKYNALVADRVVEVQFSSIRDFIDSRCRHDDAHHGCYKLQQYCRDILPILFPEALTDVPWPSDFVTNDEVTLPQTNVDIWHQLVTHVRAHDNKGKL
ncbi:hypothetical protein K8R04_04715 [Candidatus Uhrbacteria bacterium]|nr:hypothetical protein [Candidatus Uhrbacteria bacterium]